MRTFTLLTCLGAMEFFLDVVPAAKAQTVAPAAAVTAVPYSAGAALRQSEDARRNAPRATNAAPVLPQLVEPQLTLDSKETLLIHHIDIDGPMLVDAAEVRKILEAYENRKLNLAQIYEAADKLTNLYREAGYLVAKAYVPAQDARKGTLHFKMVPGKYGSVTVKNESLVREDYLQTVIDHALGGATYIHKDELERAMLLVSDLQGSGTPRIAIAPGKEQETSDFVFSVPEARRISGYFLADNGGPGFTGRDRLNGGVNLNSPFGFGDKLTAFGLLSDQRGLVTGRVAYSAPLGYDGLTGEVGALHTRYQLSGIYADLEATGIAEGIFGTLTYALRRTQNDSIYLSASFTHRWVDDRIAGADLAGRTLDFGTAAISRDWSGSVMGLNLPFTTTTSLSITSGYVNYPDATEKADNLAGAATQGNYTRINLSFNGTLGLTDKLFLDVALSAQKSLQGNLDSSEQFYTSGADRVRSVDEGIGGDSGFLVKPELKYLLPDINSYHHSVALFSDVSGAWLEDHSHTVTQNAFTSLNDFGAGYYANLEYATGRYLILKVEVAHSFGIDDSVALTKSYDRRTKGLAQVGFTF